MGFLSRRDEPGKDKEILVQELLVHRERLYRTSLVFSKGNIDRAQEIFQETMLAACQSLGRYRGRASLYTYLYRILLNTHYRFLRQERRRKDVPLDTVERFLGAKGNNPLEEMVATERRESLYQAIMSLPPKSQVVVLLRHLEGLSYEEIAKHLSIPLGTVRSRLSTARGILSRILKKPNF